MVDAKNKPKLVQIRIAPSSPYDEVHLGKLGVLGRYVPVRVTEAEADQIIKDRAPHIVKVQTR